MNGHGHGEIGRVWRDGERERDGRFRERGRGRFRGTERWRFEEREMGRRVRKLEKNVKKEELCVTTNNANEEKENERRKQWMR